MRKTLILKSVTISEDHWDYEQQAMYYKVSYETTFDKQKCIEQMEQFAKDLENEIFYLEDFPKEMINKLRKIFS